MKKTVLRVLSLTMAVAILLAASACGEKAEPADATTLSTSALDEIISTEAVTSEIADASETTGTDASATDVTDETETTEAGVPQSKEEIIAAYTEVMNKAKTDKPGYKKAEWQTLPEDAASRQIEKTSGILPMSQLIEAALNLVNKNYMTSEADAKANVQNTEKGSDMRWFPVYKSPKGCMLTNTDAVSKATAEEMSNGNIKLTIKLKSEMNPEPVLDGSSTPQSNHGAVFSPLSRTRDIDPELQSGVVQAVAKDLNYSLKYFDCVATLVYNPKTMQVVTLNQILNVQISGTGKLLGCGVDISQVLKAYTDIWDVKY